MSHTENHDGVIHGLILQTVNTRPPPPQKKNVLQHLLVLFCFCLVLLGSIFQEPISPEYPPLFRVTVNYKNK